MEKSLGFSHIWDISYIELQFYTRILRTIQGFLEVVCFSVSGIAGQFAGSKMCRAEDNMGDQHGHAEGDMRYPTN